MPIYEYRCRKCNRKSEIITFRASEDVSATAATAAASRLSGFHLESGSECPKRLEWSAWPIRPASQASMKTTRRVWRNG